MDRVTLLPLSRGDLIALIEAQAGQIVTLAAAHAHQIAALTARINRHRGVCPCCRKPVSAPAPEGFEPGSPFGPGIAALVIHLHITQAVSFERLSRLMDEVFGLSISEGATLALGHVDVPSTKCWIANILARAQAPLVAAADTIAATVRASPVVAPTRPPRGSAARPGGSGCC